jgi:hypothetical protein
LPSVINYNKAIIHNNYLYSIGGDLDTTTIRYASIGATGSVGQWQNTTPLPLVLNDSKIVSYGDYIYALDAFTSTVRFAKINTTGSVGVWQETTPLPYTAQKYAVAAQDGYLYYMGGDTGGLFLTSTVVFAFINQTGSLSSWTVTTPLSEPQAYFPVVFNNKAMYLVGGVSQSFGRIPNVRIEKVKSDGNIQGWQETTPIKNGLDSTRALILAGNIYVMGGMDNSLNETSTISYARLSSQPINWGLAVPGGSATGTYTGTNTFTAIFSP